jgi:hypothetical protein
MIKPEERIRFYEEKLFELNSLYMRLEADQFLNFASFDSYKNLKECIYCAIDHYKRDGKR